LLRVCFSSCDFASSHDGEGALWTGLTATDFDLFHQEELGQQNPPPMLFSFGRFSLKLTAGRASEAHG